MPLEFQATITIPKVNPFLTLQILGDMNRVSIDWAREVRSNARHYPPERPGQRYKRTNTLKNNWSIDGPHLEGNGDLVTTVQNSTRYSVFVHGDAQGNKQSSFHKNRWPTELQLGVSAMSLQMRAQGALNARMQGAFVSETIRSR
jgi:hypothetical protein